MFVVKSFLSDVVRLCFSSRDIRVLKQTRRKPKTERRKCWRRKNCATLGLNLKCDQWRIWWKVFKIVLVWIDQRQIVKNNICSEITFSLPKQDKLKNISHQRLNNFKKNLVEDLRTKIGKLSTYCNFDQFQIPFISVSTDFKVFAFSRKNSIWYLKFATKKQFNFKCSWSEFTLAESN